MKITIESTPEFAHVNGLPARLWQGTTARGTPVLALITRLGVSTPAPTADVAELAEFAELAEPPTRVVDASGDYVAAPRSCSVCLARDIQRPANYVARDASGGEWFECGDHSPTDNLAETTRVVLEPIAQWFRRHELPLPGGQGKAAAPSSPACLDPEGRVLGAAEPSAAAFGRCVRSDATTGQRLEAAAMLLGLDDPTLLAGALIDAGLAIATPTALDATGEAKLDELARQCKTLRESLDASVANREALGAKLDELKRASERAWLVKDFWILYETAAATLRIESFGEAKAARDGLRQQIDRLRPAFEVCDAERRDDSGGAPHRLTSGEQFALGALHRWLHSPNGDCDLIESAQLYHEQVEGESPAECERIEADEKRLFRAAMLDAAVAGSSRVSVALAAECGSNEPLLPHAVITAIVDNEHAGDPATGQPFILNAMRGAQHGWHARHAHPDRVAEIARMHAPIAEPARSAWLTGYRLSADGVVAAAASAAGAAAETPTAPPVDDAAVAAEPFELTDGHREHYHKRLVYRAPELFTALERKIAAAIQAEQAEGER